MRLGGQSSRSWACSSGIVGKLLARFDITPAYINFKREREKQRAAAREGGVVAQTFAESDVVRTWLKRVAVGIKRYDDRDLLDRNTPSGQDLVELTNKIDELDEEQGVKPHKKRP